jgi:cytochrome c peroxidase
MYLIFTSSHNNRFLQLLSISCFYAVVNVFTGCSEKPLVVATSETELGKALFFDPILSRDSSISCASCHQPQFAFADNKQFSKGMSGELSTRNTPSIMNLKERQFYFWDGRVATLQEQALAPIENSHEMNMPMSLAIKNIVKNAFYKKSFQIIYGKLPDKDLIAKALAAYEETLETSNSAFDRYVKEKDTISFSQSAKRGLEIFNGKGKCFDCHFGPDFSGNDDFKNIGLYNGQDLNDAGRFLIDNIPKNLGRFKTPGLRNVAQTAPYMHNGMFKNLLAVINYYDNPDKIVANSLNRDTAIKILNLSEKEKKDLESFLLSLSDEQFLKR